MADINVLVLIIRLLEISAEWLQALGLLVIGYALLKRRAKS